MTAYVVLMRKRTRNAVEFDAYMAKIPSTRANHAATRLAVFGKLTKAHSSKARSSSAFRRLKKHWLGTTAQPTKMPS
jgi:hypothetical protein